MIAFRERKPDGPTDEELMRRWSAMDIERDHALYEEWKGYRAWLMQAKCIVDSPEARRFYLKNRGALDNP